jgi:hypothetical protein
LLWEAEHAVSLHPVAELLSWNLNLSVYLGQRVVLAVSARPLRVPGKRNGVAVVFVVFVEVVVVVVVVVVVCVCVCVCVVVVVVET